MVTTFTFSENVGASLQPTDLVVRQQPSQSTSVVSSVSFDAATNTATFTLANPVADGNYLATLSGAGVTDLSGNPLAADHDYAFFFLRGDADRNGTVNLDDFNILALNFGTSGKVFSQGNFSYDAAGNVDLDDFNVLAGKFGTSLSPASRSSSLLTSVQSPTATRGRKFRAHRPSKRLSAVAANAATARRDPAVPS